jgi:uncharacterized integral membrane protein (TIGR00701 family)
MDTYLTIKSLHIIFVVTWFAGLFYMFRLFVYHTEASRKTEPARSILIGQLSIMENKLWYVITWPSNLVVVVEHWLPGQSVDAHQVIFCRFTLGLSVLRSKSFEENK